MQVSFWNLHSAVDIAWSNRWKYRLCVMVHRFYRPIFSSN